ncbi:hypothetical protein OG792_19185 [Micromonospora sp. NBC_01699]|uniref:hypothetical protein n=1 Tax=Micromonospora sp. NBC_01699 TaxID=2975984 RepID=UPI002E2A75AA|nr:hypothetical protein [Micromonospora sp. NBC_01699]
MYDPVLVAVAAALAGKAAEGLSEGGRAAFAALARLVRRKVQADPPAQAALESAQAEPDDDARIRRLAQVLESAVARDRLFADELGRLWDVLRDQQAVAVDGAVVNQVSGGVSGTVVQARDIRGGISFGSANP